ncbi:MAG: ACR3 family arsenite efflux transporter [Proteobacteria bacterium]|nr:ACR3 family arsenite efflux transporter [Pseudomonadota bacterium]
MQNQEISFFEKNLSIWVGLAIILGVILGKFAPAISTSIAHIEFAHVNLVVAILIWAMVFPMMVNIDYSNMGSAIKSPRAFGISLLVTWLIMPFSMAGLGILFLKHIFAPFIPLNDANQYVAGLILLGAAPCTAMVFVWSRLVKGNANYTLAQVSLNDVILIFAYAPLVSFLLGVTDIKVPWDTLLLSVGLFVVVPMVAGFLARKALLARSESALNGFLDHLKPYSIIGLLATVVLLFSFQAETLLAKPLVIAMIGIPIIIQSALMFALSYFGMCKACVPHDVAAPASMISASNFFELAVAVAISLFGLDSGAALATVVGVLVEVPAMLWLVGIANKTNGLFKT